MSAHSPEEIHALIAAALNAGDRDAFAELYEEDAMLDRPASRAARQRQGSDPRRDRADVRARPERPARGRREARDRRPRSHPRPLEHRGNRRRRARSRCRGAERSSLAASRTAAGEIVLDNPMGPF